jgi:hypothetical protein
VGTNIAPPSFLSFGEYRRVIKELESIATLLKPLSQIMKHKPLELTVRLSSLPMAELNPLKLKEFKHMEYPNQ